MIGTSEFALIIVLILAAAFFINAIKAKESAVDAAKKQCSQANVQFLDGTAVLKELRPMRSRAGAVQLYRYYQFDYSEDGSNRRCGEVIMVGSHINHCSLHITLNR